VIVANHQSNYDLFVIGQVVPRRTVAIGKKSLGWVPLFGQLFWLGGNVLIDRKNASRHARPCRRPHLAARHLDLGLPRRHAQPGEQLLPFKKGAFHMALEAGVPIVPVCVSRYRGA
jgi:1-acyl-sn-glycerol-3-phosphate acyltransferase